MTRETTLDTSPDLRRLYATAALRRGNDRGTMPDERVALAGIRVSVADLAGYSRVCGFPVTGALPLPYPHLLAFPLQMLLMSDDRFPLPLLGAVHVENTVTVHRPLSVDDALDLTVWAQNLRPHRRGRQVDLVSEVTVAGEVAWRGTSTYLARGREHPDAPSAEPPPLTALDTVTSGPVWRLASGAGRTYAGVSGDWNPIHVHALTARPLGFPSAIAHGMFTYAKVVAALGPVLPEQGLTSRVWFRKPVRLPGAVRLRTAIQPGHALSLVENARGGVEHAIVEHTW